jgi:4a-hydroxytetrahydrobiopterin dehydratase
MPKLTDSEIQERIGSLKGWDRLGDMLTKNWQLASPHRALEFTNRVAELAVKHDHFPEISLRQRDVRVELSTHSEGGVTDRDFALASAIDDMAFAFDR